MKVEDVLAAAKDSITVRRVYAEPVERDGTTVIAAAAVSGGGGGGGGTDGGGQEGSGGGFGVGAKPVGAYVIQDGRVSWLPAVDVNRLMTVLGVVVVAGLAIGARIVKVRASQGCSACAP
ncbi:spore germination protein GerW family protein [Nocardia sp. NBC_01503]|uniref:spore germination protein GerW family protein n=1 Tax=Nocardia sp. NBC_01503 TaxID=2975997 RepID=UPI002E7B17C0|nr:spore germination protein GerW family protein [Nocardia sp. NBC_01503]WTL32333.1 spore germination protein GerW family protein [Nocardia sp. NBC_01503]